MTAARLALLKSYSSRMVLVCLATTGFTSGNQARPLSALSVDDHKHSTQSIYSQSDEALLILGVGVFDLNAIGSRSACSACAKADAVLPQVGSRFGWIELERHVSLCIPNAYLQAHEARRTKDDFQMAKSG